MALPELKTFRDEQILKLQSELKQKELELEKADEAIKVLREALQFYADKESWDWSDEFHGHEYFLKIQNDETVYAAGHHGGKKAREALLKCDQIMGKGE